MNTFVRRLYGEVHRLKPSVKMGISPFGIWRPGNPAGITGLDAFASLFADSKKWLENGGVDYLAPQLYWPLSSTGQNFTALLDWWIGANTQRRHLWPGLAAYVGKRPASRPSSKSSRPVGYHTWLRFDVEASTNTSACSSCAIAWYTAARARPVAVIAAGPVSIGWAGSTSISAHAAASARGA